MCSTWTFSALNFGKREIGNAVTFSLNAAHGSCEYIKVEVSDLEHERIDRLGVTVAFLNVILRTLSRHERRRISWRLVALKDQCWNLVDRFA
jgi:hypothetical protein